MGSRVHYQVALPENDITGRIMLLTSPLISVFHYRKLFSSLTAEGIMCALVDLPGFGASDTNAPQGANMRANILWGLLDEIDNAAGTPMSMWHLMAHGTACSAILEMASLYPDSVASQIHLSPMFAVPDRKKANMWLTENLQDERRFRKSITWLTGHQLDDFIASRMLSPLMRPGGADAFRRMLDACATPQKGIGFCPTIAIWGGADPLMNAENVEAAKRLLKGGELHVLKTAGHFPMETHSVALNDYLRGWIRYINGDTGEE